MIFRILMLFFVLISEAAHAEKTLLGEAWGKSLFTYQGEVGDSVTRQLIMAYLDQFGIDPSPEEVDEEIIKMDLPANDASVRLMVKEHLRARRTSAQIARVTGIQLDQSRPGEWACQMFKAVPLFVANIANSVNVTVNDRRRLEHELAQLNAMSHVYWRERRCG